MQVLVASLEISSQGVIKTELHCRWLYTWEALLHRVGSRIYHETYSHPQRIDSSFGGCASPIFEDDTFVSLPIPEDSARLRFSDVAGKHLIDSIVEDLTRNVSKPLKASDHVHLDPDLQFDSLPRKPGWRPLFGQADAAEGHLYNSKVVVGDIFLFFGWFRRVETRNGHLRFRPGAPDVHMFFGWLEVGDIWRLWEENCETLDWASEHPHIGARYRKEHRIRGRSDWHNLQGWSLQCLLRSISVDCAGDESQQLAAA